MFQENFQAYAVLIVAVIFGAGVFALALGREKKIPPHFDSTKPIRMRVGEEIYYFDTTRERDKFIVTGGYKDKEKTPLFKKINGVIFKRKNELDRAREEVESLKSACEESQKIMRELRSHNEKWIKTEKINEQTYAALTKENEALKATLIDIGNLQKKEAMDRADWNASQHIKQSLVQLDHATHKTENVRMMEMLNEAREMLMRILK